jgi:hypothetical protein
MLITLLTGLPAMLLCLLLQAVFLTFCLRRYARLKQHFLGDERPVIDLMLLSLVMLVMLLGNFLQIAIWALLFMLIGEFDDFATAVYHSGVNFATLGYGDIVMSPEWRLLGPLQAANGILMFGVSTATMTAAVMDVLKENQRNQKNSR